MSHESRKGFKFVKKSGNVETANVDFDKLDETPEPKSSGKRKSEGSSVSSKNDKKARASSISRSRYPHIEYNFDSQKIQSSSSESSEDQYQQLTEILNGICKKEITALQDHFKKTKSNPTICATLVGVLNRLPSTVSSNPIDETFSPELSKEERSELKALAKERDELRVFLNRLTELEESPELLNSQYDMWAAPDRTSRSSASFNKEIADRTKALDNIVVEYRQLLKSLESRCDVIISGTGELNSQVDAARRAQEEVYDVFNKARLETSSSSAGTKTTNIPTDPKDVLRQFGGVHK